MSFDRSEQTGVDTDGYCERLAVDGVLRFIFMAVLMGILAGTTAATGVIFFDLGSLSAPLLAFTVLWFLGVIYTIVLMSTYKELKIRIGKENLDLKLGLFHSSIPLSKISQTHIGRCDAEPTFRQWLGPGILIGRGFRSWDIPFRGGVSVHFRVGGKKRLYYISSKTPAKFKEALDRFSDARKSGSDESNEWRCERENVLLKSSCCTPRS